MWHAADVLLQDVHCSPMEIVGVAHFEKGEVDGSVANELVDLIANALAQLNILQLTNADLERFCVLLVTSDDECDFWKHVLVRQLHEDCVQVVLPS